MTDKNDNLIPKLRFPEFKNDGKWGQKLVKGVCSIETGKSNTQDQDVNGLYPFFIRSENPVKSNKYLYDCESVITIGDGKIGQVFHYINGKFDLHQRCYKMSDFHGVDGKYFFYYFSSHFYERAMRMSAKATVDSVRLEMISEMPIYLPSMKEQKRIADFLTSLDDLLSGTKAKLEQLNTHKKALLQRLFPVPGKTVPEFRLPAFRSDGEWRVLRLDEVAKKRTQRNTELLKLPVLTNSAAAGVVNQFEYFDREIVSNENLSNYFIVEKNDFVYNPRISSVAPVGPISRNKVGLGIVSPLYSVFGFSEGCIDFFEQFFQSNNWHKYLKEKANYGARYDRINISSQDFWALPIPFPNINEQQRIASLLLTVDEMINGYTLQVKTLEEYKKGLLQQLFPAS